MTLATLKTEQHVGRLALLSDKHTFRCCIIMVIVMMMTTMTLLMIIVLLTRRTRSWSFLSSCVCLLNLVYVGRQVLNGRIY